MCSPRDDREGSDGRRRPSWFEHFLMEAAMSTAEDRASGRLRDGNAEIGEQRLHYVEAGDGPLIVLLHG